MWSNSNYWNRRRFIVLVAPWNWKQSKPFHFWISLFDKNFPKNRKIDFHFSLFQIGKYWTMGPKQCWPIYSNWVTLQLQNYVKSFFQILLVQKNVCIKKAFSSHQEGVFGGSFSSLSLAEGQWRPGTVVTRMRAQA